MKIIWTPQARQDRRDIFAYIAEDNGLAADRIDQLLDKAATRLQALPRIGRPGIVAGTRELVVHANYRIVYQIHDDALWILSVVHSARRWPPSIDDDEDD